MKQTLKKKKKRKTLFWAQIWATKIFFQDFTTTGC